ncbi:hypothetical protein [Flagellimonas iocasae]|uniref:Uncharacterized protein n=1 Tax=Flagellimonas iocasae TaxID=2055905 RepID=A0ABW4Y091_9FLAO
MTNKIKINDNLWFTVLGNKLIFGHSKKSQNHHHTISYGNKSGFFDLHLKNERTGKYFTVITFSHQNFLEILPWLKGQIFNSIFDLECLNKTLLIQDNFELFEIHDLGDLTQEFGILTKKNRIQINQASDEFKTFIDLLLKKHQLTKVDFENISKKNQFHGIAKSENDNFLLIKNPFLGNELYRLNDLDLNIESVLRKILGDEVYEQVLRRLNEGITELEK